MTSRPLRETFRRFIALPDFNAQPALAAATKDNPRFDFRLVRPAANGDPDESDLQSVVDLSHYNAHIRRANLGLSADDRAGLYSLWFRRNQQAFLLLERAPPDRYGIAVIGNTAVLPLRQKTFERIALGEFAVVNLRDEDVCRPGEPFDVLLFDTWIIHDDYQDLDRGLIRRLLPNKSHGGYGNALALRHLALFWDPKRKLPLRLAVEPDSRSMDKILRRMGFEIEGSTKIRKPLLELYFPPEGSDTATNVLRRRLTRDLAGKVHECSQWKFA